MFVVFIISDQKKFQPNPNRIYYSLWKWLDLLLFVDKRDVQKKKENSQTINVNLKHGEEILNLPDQISSKR